MSSGYQSYGNPLRMIPITQDYIYSIINWVEKIHYETTARAQHDSIKQLTVKLKVYSKRQWNKRYWQLKANPTTGSNKRGRATNQEVALQTVYLLTCCYIVHRKSEQLYTNKRQKP